MLHYVCKVEGQDKESGMWNVLKEFHTEGYVEEDDQKFLWFKFKNYGETVYTKTQKMIRIEAREFADLSLGPWLNVVIDEYGYREGPDENYSSSWFMGKIWENGKWLFGHSKG